MTAKALHVQFLPGMGGTEMQRVDQRSLSACSKSGRALEFRDLSGEHNGCDSWVVFFFTRLWRLAKTIPLKAMTLGCQSQVLETEK